MSAVGAVKTSANILPGFPGFGRFLKAVREVLAEAAALREKHRGEHPFLEW